VSRRYRMSRICYAHTVRPLITLYCAPASPRGFFFLLPADDLAAPSRDDHSRLSNRVRLREYLAPEASACVLTSASPGGAPEVPTVPAREVSLRVHFIGVMCWEAGAYSAASQTWYDFTTFYDLRAWASAFTSRAPHPKAAEKGTSHGTPWKVVGI
jgi:hypothetical protein